MCFKFNFFAFIALTLLVWQQEVEGHLACKNWVLRHGYLSAARCKWVAYGPADATATPSSLGPVKSKLFTFYRLTQGVLEKRLLNGWSNSSSSSNSFKFNFLHNTINLGLVLNKWDRMTGCDWRERSSHGVVSTNHKQNVYNDYCSFRCSC